MKEVVRSLRSILLEQHRAVSEWVDVLTTVQWAHNTAFRPRYAYHVMFGRAPKTSFSALAKSSVGEWKLRCHAYIEGRVGIARTVPCLSAETCSRRTLA